MAWKGPDEGKIEKAQEWIGELQDEIKLEREKVPGIQEWEKMNYEERKDWIKHAIDEQLKKASYEA